MLQKFSSFARPYCTILTVMTFSGLLLSPLASYIFGLDFAATLSFYVMLLSLEEIRALPYGDVLSVLAGATLIICLLMLIGRILWKRLPGASRVLFVSVTIVDCAFLIFRIVCSVPGYHGAFYFCAALLWRVLGLLCLLASCQRRPGAAQQTA